MNKKIIVFLILSGKLICSENEFNDKGLKSKNDQSSELPKLNNKQKNKTTAQKEYLKPIYFPIYFKSWKVEIINKSDLDYNIEEIKKMLQEHPAYFVAIIGNSAADADGSFFQDNLVISFKRASFVRDILIQAGIPLEKIRIYGKGYQKPKVHSKEGPEAQAIDMRVDMYLAV